MKRQDFEKDVRSFVEGITQDQLDELWGMMVEYGDERADEAVDATPDEDELWDSFEASYEIPGHIFNDLDECVRCFDSDPKTAKQLLSRALKDLPGAPRWLD